MLYDPNWQPGPIIKRTDLTKTWQEILLKAADLIESRGWTRYQFENSEGSLCMIGAMRVAVYGSTSLNSPAENELIMADNKLAGFLGCHVSAWNDRGAVSKEEVIAKLREAAHAV
jgi:hypothetical protein